MDSIISSALEEICFHGQGGISLSSLCSKLEVPPPLKSSLWKNLLSIPTLLFRPRNAEFLSPNDASIQCAEDAEKLDVKILADEKLRNNFVGLYDENVQISSQQRRTLERLAIARTNGVTQSQLAKEFGIEGKNFFYILKNLECRGLIVKQPAVVRKIEPCTEGESKNILPVTTKLIYLTRYAKRLGCQQRFEINKEEQTVESLGYDDENVPDDDGFALENAKENVLVNDYLPAMKAVCDKLEEANGKVLVISDIKRDLGYTRSSGHKAWRNIYRRLKDAGLVEDLQAVVNEKVELCLRLVKRFSEKTFGPKLLGCDHHHDKGQPLKFGRTIPNVDQIVELPIDNQIYDMVDAEGSEGLPVMTVCAYIFLILLYYNGANLSGYDAVFLSDISSILCGKLKTGSSNSNQDVQIFTNHALRKIAPEFEYLLYDVNGVKRARASLLFNQVLAILTACSFYCLI